MSEIRPTNDELAAWSADGRYGSWEIRVSRENWNRLIHEVRRLRALCGEAAPRIEFPGLRATIPLPFEWTDDKASDLMRRLRAEGL